MRTPATLGFSALALLSVLAAACDVDVTGDASTEGGATTTGPEFTEGQGQAPGGELAYPPAPYGYVKGTVVGNYVLYGYPNAAVDKTAQVKIELADFYNPTGDGVFPEGSPYGAGEPKPKALVIDVGSVWCGPCNYEAQTELPPRYAEYQPLGGEILSVLADGPTPGTAAKPTALTSWVTKYKANYPSAIDPSYALGQLFVADAFPQNIMVDLRTMKIVEVVAGVPDAAFWTKFEQLLQ